mmetsp:Transcript_5581/g.23602  ORF Transcript_5581/g.23602 Transcript_5581/m.23602 type:complete len:332 (+) Transcript_5581:688-1683(+)
MIFDSYTRSGKSSTKFLPTCTPMSVPTRSFKRNGPMGMPNILIAPSMAYGSHPRSKSRHADIVYGKNTRLTANPVQLPTTTGVFLICFDRPSVSHSTCGGVCSVRMISKSCMTCAGEKKCAPTMRSGARIFAAHLVMSMVDVFVLRMASGRHAASRSAKIFCFSSTFSMTASMAMSTFPKSSYVSAGRHSANIASARACVRRPFFTALARLARTRPMPASRNFWLISLSTTATPFITHAVAMPLPIKPPPTTPTVAVFRGVKPTSVTPGTVAVCRDAKKKCTRPLHAALETALSNDTRSTFKPSSAPFTRPASMASRHSQGCGITLLTRFA